jgi:hypothetical protein
MGIMLDVYASGGDAVKNMYGIEFHGLPQGVGDTESLGDGYTGIRDGKPCYRARTVQIPKIGLTTYDVDVRTAKIKMPGGKLEMDTQFTTELRIDRYWQVYKDLVVWRNKLASPDGRIGDDVWIAPNDSRNTRAEKALIKAYMLGTGSTASLVGTDNIPPKHVWEFLRVLPLTVPNVDFDFSSGENITISVEFGFIEMKDHHLNADGATYDDLNQTGAQAVAAGIVNG